MLVKDGNFADLKEEFLTSELIEGKESEFKALAPTHLVIQNKSEHPVRHAIDYTSLNGFFSKRSNTLSSIDEKVCQIRAHKFIFGMDVSKQFNQIMTQSPYAQCILHRSKPDGPLEVSIHNAILMGHVSSSSLAGLCLIETGRLFDKMVDDGREGKLDLGEVYLPLAKALQPSGILDPVSIPESFSLEVIIAESMYADNIILTNDERTTLSLHATATILALNAFSFRVHEVFANAIPELLQVVDSIQQLGGHAAIHPKIKLIIDEQNRAQDTDANVFNSDDTNENTPSSETEAEEVAYPGSAHQPPPPTNLDDGSVADAVAAKSTNPETFLSKPSEFITINTKPFLYTKDNNISYLNPHSLLKIYGLNLEVSTQSEISDTLEFKMSYHALASLQDFDASKVTLRRVSELLGSCWEPQPFALTSLKSHLKIVLHLCYKIKQVLSEDRKLLLSLVTCTKPPNSKAKGLSPEKWYLKHQKHPIYSKLSNLKSRTTDQHLLEIKKNIPIMGWDTPLDLIRDQILDCYLVSDQVKKNMKEAIDFCLLYTSPSPRD